MGEIDEQSDISSPDNGGRLIIIVDDDKSNRKLLVTILEKEGYRVVSFLESKDALASLIGSTAAREIPDLLITDVMMPVMVGTELAQKVRGIYPGISVLFVTGNDFGLLGRYAEETGESPDFIKKPFSIEQLLRMIDYILNGRQPTQRANFIL